jgi:hypothetical protein
MERYPAFLADDSGEFRKGKAFGMKFRWILITIVAVVLLAFYLRPDDQWHQKITMTVETPTGDITGSSVQGGFVKNTSRGPTTYLFGEVPFVEVTPGRYLFAILRRPNAIFFSQRAPVKDVNELLGLREQREIPPSEYPLLLTFRKMGDPKSAERVDPNDLAASFGPGVRLKSMTIEVTDEPVTRGKIERVLPCLNRKPDCVDFMSQSNQDRIFNSEFANSPSLAGDLFVMAKGVCLPLFGLWFCGKVLLDALRDGKIGARPYYRNTEPVRYSLIIAFFLLMGSLCIFTAVLVLTRLTTLSTLNWTVG